MPYCSRLWTVVVTRVYPFQNEQNRKTPFATVLICSRGTIISVNLRSCPYKNHHLPVLVLTRTYIWRVCTYKYGLKRFYTFQYGFLRVIYGLTRTRTVLDPYWFLNMFEHVQKSNTVWNISYGYSRFNHGILRIITVYYGYCRIESVFIRNAHPWMCDSGIRLTCQCSLQIHTPKNWDSVQASKCFR